MAWKCSICFSLLDEDKENKECSCTPCGHVFHSECLKRWFTSKCLNARSCPECRTSVYHPIKLYPTSDSESVNKKEITNEVSSLKSQLDALNLKTVSATAAFKSEKVKAEKLLQDAKFRNTRTEKLLKEEKCERIRTEKLLKDAIFEKTRIERILQQSKSEKTKIETLLQEEKFEKMRTEKLLQEANFEKMKTETLWQSENFEKMKAKKELQIADFKLEKMQELQQQIQHFNSKLAAELSFYKNAYIMVHGEQIDVDKILQDIQVNVYTENPAEIQDTVKKLLTYCSILKRELCTTMAVNGNLKDELTMFKTEFMVTHQNFMK